jgi:hypothetical protein
MKGWRDASYARDRVLRAAKMFEDGKVKASGMKRKVAV